MDETRMRELLDKSEIQDVALTLSGPAVHYPAPKKAA